MVIPKKNYFRYLLSNGERNHGRWDTIVSSIRSLTEIK